MAVVEDLGIPQPPPVDEEVPEDQYADEEIDETYLSEEDRDFVDQMVVRTVMFCEELADMELRPYQREMAMRIVESVILADGEEITGCWCRQSGKSQTLAIVVAGMLVLFPKLALSFDMFERFKRGMWVGMYAPVDNQSEFIFTKVMDILKSQHAKVFLTDPEIDEKITAGSKLATLKSGSYVRRQTANPKAKIEGASYHLVIVDEAQDVDDMVVRKSIAPMLASVAGSMVKIGTPSFHKGDFHRAIQLNKRRATKRGGKRFHFEYDYRVVSKYNPYYAKFIKREKIRIGEDSDEFLMCVAPDTKVLTADLRYIPASDVVEGMKLVGFDEHRPGPGLHRKFKETEVEAVADVVLPSYRLLLDDGTEMVCSSDHLWLVTTAGRRTVWKKTEDLTPADKIFKVADVWEQEDTRETGYLAGIFDGEGHLSRVGPGNFQIGMSQKDGVVLEQTKEHLSKLGYLYWMRGTPHGTHGDVRAVNLAGGGAAQMRFLGHIRPQRLLDKFDINQCGSIGRHDHKGQDFRHPAIMEKEFLGPQKVVAFRTSTRTFVAEGLASHNSYALKWMLDRGMLVTEDELDYLADPSMQVERSWFRSPVVVGIDPARVQDSTVVTVCWVDWDHPDPAGYREHRILNWLELQNTDYEEQYFEICEFLEHYDIAYIGVDAQGMGGPMADRLKRLLGHRCEVVALTSDLKNQSERWQHLIQLIQRRMIVYPGHSKARRLRAWKRFRQQMEDAEKLMRGQYLLIQAPDDTREAHDDYCDSLALATMMSQHDTVPEAEISSAPWF